MSKFSVGEVCEALKKSDGDVWSECEIISISDGIDSDYVIRVQGDKSPYFDGNWGALEHELRKKRPPPEQLDNQEADEDFKQWFKEITREKVTHTSH